MDKGNLFIANIGDSDEEGNHYYASTRLIVVGIDEESFAKLVHEFWKQNKGKGIYGVKEREALVAFLRERGVNVAFESKPYDEVEVDLSWKFVRKNGNRIGRSK